MADIREMVLKDRMGTGLFRLRGWSGLSSTARLTLRRGVVASSIWPFTLFYSAIYRIHVKYAVRMLRQFANTRSVYATGGIASGDVVFGISDIDLVVIGTWPDEERLRVIAALKKLSASSPLYDPALSHGTHSVTELVSLYNTDLYFQYRFEQGRRSWKLLYGPDSLAELPSGDDGRAAGGILMGMRLWWGCFAASAFGCGPTSRDRLFRNSIAFKTSAEMLHLVSALDDEKQTSSRRKRIECAATNGTGRGGAYFAKLLASHTSRYRQFDGDIQQETLRFLLPLMERAQKKLPSAPVFREVSKAMNVDAKQCEVPRAASTLRHVSNLVEHVKREWPGFRSAFLVPSISFFNLDDSMLLLEVELRAQPSVKQLRDLCGLHAAGRQNLQQRVALSLLLEDGAYQLETVSQLELWHLIVNPVANPDIFALLGCPEFVLVGQARSNSQQPGWTKYASALIDEELSARRAVMEKQGAAATEPLPAIELIRNLWRHLQLEIIQRTCAVGSPVIPMTPAAVQRALELCGLPAMPVLNRFREAYQAELEGTPTDIQSLLPEVMTLLSHFK